MVKMPPRIAIIHSMILSTLYRFNSLFTFLFKEICGILFPFNLLLFFSLIVKDALTRLGYCKEEII